VAAADAPALAAALAAGQRVPDGLRHLTATDAGDLAPAYRDALRKRAQPLLVALDGTTRRAAERRLFDDAYKGVTDIVTKYLWPWPAFHATRLAASLGVSANQVTWASLAFVLAALVLFRDGLYLAGLGCAWAMCLLDTVDGKLARVTLASSRFGNALDHGIDLVHPPFWYLAWAAALEDAGFAVRELTLAVVAGYVAGRLQEGLFLWRFGIEMHVWRRFDSRFRLITARRNPNLVLLSIGALAGRPELGFAAVALWTVATFGLHLVRIGQALIAGRRPGGVRSWLAEPGT
jgi:phosphatidylglycerophosphate synthase